MNLLGMTVLHGTFGLGTVIDIFDNHIKVDFGNGVIKTFVYPDAFEKFLSLSDENVMQKIRTDIEQKKNIAAEQLLKQKEKQDEFLQKQYAEREIPRRARKKKTIQRTNVAFKCNYCDGGQSKERIGFAGACSAETMDYNIRIAGRSWCSHDKCICSQYYNNQISKDDYINAIQSGSFLCYESRMLLDWTARAGVIGHGDNVGRPMKLKGVQNKSLCVLTTVAPNESEKDKMIFGIFIVDKVYEGDDIDEEGYVACTSKYHMQFSEEESRKMLFWDYHANSTQPEQPAWSSGLHRYISDAEAVQILRDAVEIKRETEDGELAKEMLSYFCEINSIDENSVGVPNGALIRAERR